LTFDGLTRAAPLRRDSPVGASEDRVGDDGDVIRRGRARGQLSSLHRERGGRRQVNDFVIED
jgi:hypothetical protein